METQYIILTRFNIPLHWPPDHEVPEGWLERRFQLFEQFCLPSVLDQEYKDFTWLVLFDAATPPSYVRRVRGYQESCPMFQPVFMSSKQASADRAYLVSTRYARAIDPYLRSDTQFVVTTRLDSDDAIHRTFMLRLHRQATTQDLTVFNFPQGYYLDALSNATFEVRDTRGTNTISFLERRRPQEDLRTVYIFDRHTEVAEHRDVEQVEGGPGWVMVTHDENIMNDIRWARALNGNRVSCPYEMLEADFRVQLDEVPPCHITNTATDILVVTPVPTHPQNYGNRKRVFRVCAELQKLGARIHLLHYPAEHGWWEQLPVRANKAMQQQWDSYFLIRPTRDRHTESLGTDHLIDEWWDESVGDYMDWLCEVQKFDMVIVNYTWMSRALEHVPKGVIKVLDTHDQVGGRRELLQQAGIEPEFFHTSEEEEAKALRRADLVLGIKEQESEYFRELGAVPTETLVHCDPAVTADREPASDGTLTIGFVGAHNSLNRVALKRFLTLALDRFRGQGNIRFLIAGTVTEYFQEVLDPIVELMPLGDEVKDFYRRVDLVVVPMTRSTGFKVKVAEALAHGKPLVASAHAVEGIPTDLKYHRYTDLEAIIDACLELARAPHKLKHMALESKQVHGRLLERFSHQLNTLLGRIFPRVALIVLSRRVGVLQLERQREIVTMIGDWWDTLLFVHGDGGSNHAALAGFRELDAVYDVTTLERERAARSSVIGWEQLQRSVQVTVSWADHDSGLRIRSGLRIVDACWGEHGSEPDATEGTSEVTTLLNSHQVQEPCDTGESLAKVPAVFFIRPPRTSLWAAKSGDPTVAWLSECSKDIDAVSRQLNHCLGPVDNILFTRAGMPTQMETMSRFEVDPDSGDLTSLPAIPSIAVDAAGDHAYYGPLREYLAWSKVPVLVFGAPAVIWKGRDIEQFATTPEGASSLSKRIAGLLQSPEQRNAAGSGTHRALKDFIECRSRIRDLRLHFRDRRVAEG